jgi:ribosomal protein S1/(E)-4-hydroxy-3-methyl-but-2-enyl pyrophosphate reductase
MEIIVAKRSGFCSGVAHAVDLALETIEAYKNTGKKICTFGDLIHNGEIKKELEEKGIIVEEDIEKIDGNSIVIVRAHGIPKDTYKLFEEKDITLIDATCRLVSRVQELAEKHHEQGEQIVIVGDKNHPEVIGINGWCDNKALIINSEEEAKALIPDLSEAPASEAPLFVVAQTTIKKETWEKVLRVLLSKYNRVEYQNTICNATRIRQEECAELAKQVDAMIIIGSKTSSNSQKLYQIAKNICERTYFIETKDDLGLNDFQKYNKIGLATGASTPERIIKEVITIMNDAENKETTEETTDHVCCGGYCGRCLSDEDATLTFATGEEYQEQSIEKSAQDNEEDALQEDRNAMENFMDEIEKSLRIPGRGEIVTGDIIQIRENEIIVNLGCKKDGIVPKSEITNDYSTNLFEMFQVGDEIEAQVLKTDDGEGNLLLSKKKLNARENWNEVEAFYKEKTPIDVKVQNAVKGGVIASYKDLTGFIPISQLSDKYVEDLNEFIGKTLTVKVTQFDKKKNKAIFSHRIFKDEENKKKMAEVWGKIEEGDIIEGKVMRFTNYGAFIDVGGVDGLLHISEISWGKIHHPSDALKIGQIVNVKVIAKDEKHEKISLGLKQTIPEPWQNVDNKLAVGDIIDGKVVQIKEYGLFVEIEPGMDGLVHISEIAHKHVADPATEVKVNEFIKAKVLDIDKENKRISLSIKATVEKPEDNQETSEPEEIQE